MFDGTRALLNVDKDSFCKKLADLLDIQADGGDDPVEVVRWAIHKAADDHNAERRQGV